MNPRRGLLALSATTLAALLGAGDLARAAKPDAPGPSALGFAGGRAGASLDGAWHIIVDPYDNGSLDYRSQPRPRGYFADAPPRDKSELVEYDFSRAPTLNVPGDWNTQRPELLFYEGIVWYERHFEYPALPEGHRLFVQFGAAAQRATVWLNGRRLGEHEGGFTPFAFEVTGLLRARDNSIVVKVDNSRRADALPALNTDWWNYGGLTRGVRLVETPRVFIRDALVQLGRASGGVHGFVQLDGGRAPVEVTIEIPEAHASRSVTTDRNGRAAFDLPATLTPWSPETPKLYDVVIRTGDDRAQDRIGFRTVSTTRHDILLNGQPVLLRGISLHEEAIGRGGRATSRADAEALLGLAKELGCNFVRLAHYPHNEEMTRAADRLGLLVWSELPVYWTIAWSNPATLATARAQLAEEIARDRNRASVILWSVGNETPVSDARNGFLRALIDDVRAADDTRLVTAALEHHAADAHTHVIDDPLGGALDVIGLNEYVGWYDGLPAKCDTMAWQVAYDKPLVVSEFGADAKAGLHGDALTRFSEEYQADLYRRQIAMLKRIPNLRGLSPWILVDFRSPRRPLPGVQDGWNRKGVVANDGTKKQAFGVLRDAYRNWSPPAPTTLAPAAAGGR